MVSIWFLLFQDVNSFTFTSVEGGTEIAEIVKNHNHGDKTRWNHESKEAKQELPDEHRSP